MHSFLSEAAPYLELAGAALFVLGVVITRWKSGATSVSQDIITTYRQRVEQLEADQQRNLERMHEHTKEIGQLQGMIAEKDKEVSRMRSILENRNPELTEVLKEIRGFMEAINAHMREHTEFIKSIKPAAQFDVTRMSE